MMFRRTVLVAATTVLCAVAVSKAVVAQDKLVTVFAAASMKNALDEVNAAFTQKADMRVVASYAATSALIRQIEQGAPADVFLSADVEWMDYGAQKKLVQPTTRVDLLGNRLVLVAPASAAISNVEIAPGVDLVKLAAGGRIVTGDVRAVPVGRYAKAALEHLGVWRAVEPKLAMAENVRAALALVARGEAPLGIVYETDAKVEPQVKVVGVFPNGSHPPIVYPVAATAAAKPQARRYLDFLRSQDAGAIFKRHGFAFLARPAS
jgi:molybdate transport system substrate-binding protein